MSTGVRGRLITESFIRDVLPGLPGVASPAPSTQRAIDAWSERTLTTLGPTSAARAIADSALLPLLSLLDLAVVGREDRDGTCWLHTEWHGTAGPLVGCIGWNESPRLAWRRVVLQAIAADVRWCLCFNGEQLTAMDARRTWSRDVLTFDVRAIALDANAAALLWQLFRGESICGTDRLLDRCVELSARHAADTCRRLGSGVVDALLILLGALSAKGAHNVRDGQRSLQPVFDESLTVLYRVLFLLFAEARGLVPIWHPIYRDQYSLEVIVSTLLSGASCRGLSQALRAISRLAHAGCTAGELKVAAFNGRLFSPARAPALEQARIDDAAMARAVMAIGSTPAAAGAARRPIVYRDLDVEQLGAVYEHVLDYEPTPAGLERTRDIRKASGTFYTPRAVTAFLVRQVLEPLVRRRSADEILALRVVDPAMGSGAFLVAACRYLATAVEDAYINEGRWHRGDITPADRIAVRREIASRCLYGVDLNPTAVQLSRLSIWLATLASNKPLSFLDHHLIAGDSLLGITPADVGREPARRQRRPARDAQLPLFDALEIEDSLGHAASARLTLAAEPDDSAAIVRDKERRLAAVHGDESALGRWTRVLDLWCATWFWSTPAPNLRRTSVDTAPDRATFNELAAHILHGRSALPDRIAATLLEHAHTIAADQRFLHWPLAFPEVFAPTASSAAPPGFDAVIGNPPWDMVRGDSGGEHTRDDRRRHARALTQFVRDSQIYRTTGSAHINRYQLFLERALQLVKPGGRVGFVLPSGIASDSGAAALRRHLFAGADVDRIIGLENRAGIFPIHRGLRFALLTATAGRPTTSIACRFGLTRSEELESDTPPSSSGPFILTRRFLARLSGEDDLGIPELRHPRDLQIVERISATAPWLGDERGWHVRFGRELNATDDRAMLSPITGASSARPVMEGKQIEPFRAATDRSSLEVAAEHLTHVRAPRRARLAYRDVASASNRLTLIAAIIPARAVTTHTLFCLKSTLPLDHQYVLCALLNSFVANYLIRMRVNTHVTVSLVSRLPVPVVHPEQREFTELLSYSKALAAAASPVEEMREYAQLQATAALLYGLTIDDFERVLETFPLVGGEVRSASLSRFKDLQR